MAQLTDDEIRQRFAKHRRLSYWSQPAIVESMTGEQVPSLEFLRWGVPEDCNWLIEYLRCGSKLFVSGDLGCATFRWSAEVRLAGIANNNIQYFGEKCQASAEGLHFIDWDEDRAKEMLIDRIDGDKKLIAEIKKKDAFKCLFSPETWRQWLEITGSPIEWSDVGVVHHWRMRAYLIGLKLAMAAQ